MTAKHEERVFGLELRIVASLCESIGSPRSLTVKLLIESGEYKQLLDLTVDPKHYVTSKAFADDYLVTSILQKNPRLPTSIDTEKVALGKFWDAERQCSEANSRISDAIKTGIFPPDVLACLEKAQAWVSRILGPLSRSSLRFAEEHMRFGPGATTSLSGVVTQGKKYSRRSLDATPRILPFRTFCFPEKWKQSAPEISPRKSSKMRVVPKNAKTGRTICIEPDLNIFVQLGVGALLRERLRLIGLDLNTQKVNQGMACRAWKDDLCTMDLSSASDTICREAVWLLLPYEWADLLHFSRTDFVETGEGVEVELHKWSSMGNGYTFELETLIFYGILLGACEVKESRFGDLAAYGDDLIFPNEMRELTESTLRFLGFSVNSGKTFGKGSFHESCGTDWFEGQNVRPVFLRSEHHDYPTVVYTYANSISTYACHTSNGMARDVRCLPAWLRCYTALPSNLRYRIPLGFGDVGFVSSFDEARPVMTRKRHLGWAGFDFAYRIVEAKVAVIDLEGCLTAFLNGNFSDYSLGYESLRGRYRSATTRRGYSLGWPHVGAWTNV